METTTRQMVLPSGETFAALGQGTWHFAEHPARRSDEIDAIRLGLDLGMTTVDTAEMYGDGASEALVGEAIAGRRDEVFLVDKVLPHHATRAGTKRACKASLARLNADHIDLYLLHWRSDVPLAETVEGFEDLVAEGLIRYWGTISCLAKTRRKRLARHTVRGDRARRKSSGRSRTVPSDRRGRVLSPLDC
jgi:diketogulonate reductase-like aldo/keto reductase